ncbi:interferon-inducible GTPase-domain-containing protein [Suillus paluster]|uniref:interferon-inducible GTPase-domain-containing protein n=1 Tax=Suillus paluster TaxID=48578 RepID=UPI001B86CDFC|nr:interferon-inducible GTPase-domain-containing protein [Suillus paluster]KAG1746765.1 interferon-inducible GTPase-domain-containing protein [Suillus paluster]
MLPVAPETPPGTPAVLAAAAGMFPAAAAVLAAASEMLPAAPAVLVAASEMLAVLAAVPAVLASSPGMFAGAAVLAVASAIIPGASVIILPSLAVAWLVERSVRQNAQKKAAKAVGALRRAEQARFTTEHKWLEGVRPECRPSEEDIVRMKAKYLYSPNFLHLAVVGSSGSGKSSFINAVRGLSNHDSTAARTGIVEATNAVMRYPDPRPNSQIIWYDVPGAGSPNVPDCQYFNDLGLYIFDCIIVLIDNRFLDSDLAILRACEQFSNVEAFIVRSKSDQHINNMAYDRMPRDFDLGDPDMDDETRSRFQQMKSEGRRRFIEETRQNVQMNLESKNHSPKKVYIVCKDALLAALDNSRPSKAIDEAELLSDVGECVRKRLQSGC